MNNENLKELINELEAEGASEKEAEDLALLSKNLNNLYSFERSSRFKTRFLEQNLKAENKFFATKQMFATAFLSLMLLLSFASIVSAQNSLPGDALYPVKIASENITSLINPSFKNQIIKRRSGEVKDLSKKSSSREFHEAVQNYEKELSRNKTTDVSNLKESQRNLEEAQRNSSEENKEDLEKVIIQTQNLQEQLEKTDVRGEQTGSSLNDEEKDNKILNPLEK